MQFETTLATLAEFTRIKAKELGATIIVAHSIASVIALVAAGVTNSPLSTIVSLEGSITLDDTFFAQTAADFDDPYTFRTVFLHRLDVLAACKPAFSRYRRAAELADPVALWELGIDVRRFFMTQEPSELFSTSTRVRYLYDPRNCSDSTLKWLETSAAECIVLDDETHCVCADQPDYVARKILEALR